MTTNVFNNRQGIRSAVKDILDGECDEKLPINLVYKDSIYSCSYNFYVTKVDQDFFVDKMGQKWMKDGTP